MTGEPFYQFDGATIDVYPLNDLLKATPFTKDSNFNFDNHINESLFFDSFYSERRKSGSDEIIQDNKQFDNDVSTYLLNLRNPATRISLLNIRGYGGCGKTTYTHHLLRSVLADPDYRDIKIEYSMLDYEQENQVVTPLERRINELLDSNLREMYLFFKTLLANNSYDISSFGQYPNFGRYTQILSKYNNLLYKGTMRLTTEDKSFFSYLESVKVWIEKKNKGANNQDNYTIYLHFLLTTLFLISIYLSKPKDKRVAVVFLLDNIDSIDDINQERILLNVMHAFMGECTAFFNANRNVDSLRRTKFIWFMTTRIITSRYYRILAPDLEHQSYWHQLDMPEYYYDHLDIIQRKINYYREQEKNTGAKAPARLSNIEDFAEAVYKSNVFQKLYNGNIRYCIDALCSLCCDSRLPKQISQVINLKKRSLSPNDEASNGANGYILSLLFNHFKKEKIYENKLHLSTCAQNNTISLSRLVLTILRESPGETCSMLDIFNEIPHEYMNQELFDTIFDLSEAYRGIWRRLLILDNLTDDPNRSIAEEYNLYKYMRDFSRNKYTNLSLCRSGKAYLEFVIPHFEFMLTRHTDSYKSTPSNDKLLLPLFDSSSTDKVRGHYAFETKIDNVFSDVKDCCVNSNYFAQQVMRRKNMNLREFMNTTRLNYSAQSTVDGENVSYHQSYGSRLIFNHVGYIEWYRRYLLKTTENEILKTVFNRSLTDRIKTYIELYTSFDADLRNKFQDHAAEDMMKAIDIITKSGYSDFLTKIERKIIRNENDKTNL